MQNAESVFKTVEVDKNDDRIAVLPRRMTDPEAIDRIIVEFEGSKIEVSDWLEKTETDSLLVLHDGAIVVETYFGEMRPSTRHLTWSLGKALLSLLVLQCDKVNPANAIDSYVPALKPTAFSGATVQHVLDQQTGLAFQETPPDNQPKTLELYTFGTKEFREAKHEYAQYERTTGILPKLTGESAIDGLYDILLRQTEAARPHGSTLWYAEPNIIALQQLLETVAQERIVAHLENELWKRIGAEHRINAIVDGIGTPAFGTGISMSTRDVGRLGQLLLNRGQYNGQKIVSKGVVEDILTERNVGAINDASNFSDWAKYRPGYRNLFWTWPSEDGQRPLLSALGLYGQHCVVDFNNGNVIVKFSSNPNFAHLTEDVNAIRTLSNALS
tara:strand:+ start:12081 stop:13238 length:1158 start_codon:yes stop_codon:yes gene_type:complete